MLVPKQTDSQKENEVWKSERPCSPESRGILWKLVNKKVTLKKSVVGASCHIRQKNERNKEKHMLEKKLTIKKSRNSGCILAFL